MPKPYKAPTFSESRQCGHCGNHATMEVVAEYKDFSIKNYENYPFEEGTGYKLLKCPACEKVELERYDYCEGFDDGPDFNHQTLYPVSPEVPIGLPKNIRTEYESALKHKLHTPPNAYGVLMGRVLELVCIDRKAKGRMLGDKLKDLSARKEFPTALLTVAYRLNALRIFGAHAKGADLTAKEVPIVENLTRAILEYVYSAPYYVRQAEKALLKLRIKAGPPPRPNQAF